MNAISLIERGENSPTVSSLHLLATALRMSITDVFKEEQDQAVVFVRPVARIRSQANGIAMESLGIGLAADLSHRKWSSGATPPPGFRGEGG